MKKKLLEEGICLNTNSGNKFFDYINSQWLTTIEENLSQGYVKKENIPLFDIDIDKLKDAIKWFNGFLNFLPTVQENYVKALILPNFCYILKEDCHQKRDVIKSVVINGVTGASKTSIAMLIYYMFNIDAEWVGLETTPFEFNTQASIRNALSKNAGIVLFDEMDEDIVNVRGDKHFTQEFKDLLKNTYKMKLKGTANLEIQGENKEYAYLGAPILTLNTDVVIESATKQRVRYFRCTDSCVLSEYKKEYITEDTIDMLRELGKAIWLIVKDTDFSDYITDTQILKAIVDKINDKYQLEEDDRLVDLYDIQESEATDRMSSVVYYSIQMNLQKYGTLIDVYQWIKENRKGEILIHKTDFYKGIQMIIHDYTVSSKSIYKEFNLDTLPTKSKQWGKKTQRAYVFPDENAFLEHIGYFKWLHPEKAQENQNDINWAEQEKHMLKELKTEVEESEIKNVRFL